MLLLVDAKTGHRAKNTLSKDQITGNVTTTCGTCDRELAIDIWSAGDHVILNGGVALSWQ